MDKAKLPGLTSNKRTMQLKNDITRLQRSTTNANIKMHEKFVEEKKREKELNKRAWDREEEKLKRLITIDENVKYIAREIKNIHLNLINIDLAIKQSNLSKEEILTQLKEVKHIEAYIYEAFVKHDISTEKGRLEASEKLSTKLKDGVDVVGNLASIIPIILGN